MTSHEVTLDIGAEFARLPFGRFPEDGPNNGQRFREEFLIPMFEKCERLVVILDNARGMGSSFLDEAFGVFAKKCGLTLAEFKRRIEIISRRDPSLSESIEQYVLDHTSASIN